LCRLPLPKPRFCDDVNLGSKRILKCTDRLASAGKATGLATLVDGVDDPVDSGIPADLYR
jgi:hypothetical protein